MRPASSPRWAEILAALPFTLLVLVIVAAVVAAFPGADSHEQLAALRADLLPGSRDLLKPEGLERRLFMVLVPVLPLAAAAGLLLARRIGPLRGISGVALILAIVTGIAGIKILHGVSQVANCLFLKDPLADLFCLLAAVILAIRIPCADWRIRRGVLTWVCVLVAAGFVLLPRGLGVGDINEHQATSRYWSIHFQAVFHPLTQAVAGKAMSGFPPALYGGFHWLLAPLFHVTGLSVARFCIVMALLQASALATLVFTGFRVVRNPLLAVLLACTLAFVTGGGWALAYGNWDPYFQYWPVRFLFPAAVVCLALCIGPGIRVAVAGGAIAGIALVWNLESGVAAAGGLAAVFFLEMLARRPAAWRLTAAFFAATAATTALTLWCLPPGSFAKLSETAGFQALFYRAGFCMEPLPLMPHPWHLVALTYVIGILAAVRGVLMRRAGRFERACCCLAVTGLGLFVYYQGRSHDYNLISVSWPAVMLGFIFADRLFRAARLRLLPRAACAAVVPLLFLAVSTCTVLAGAMPDIIRTGVARWSSLLNPRETPLMARIRFVREHVGADRECTILAQFQAVYFGEAGLRSQLDGPGLTEIFTLTDCRRIADELTSRPSPHLFVEAGTIRDYGLEPALSGYRLAGKSPKGELMYYEPLAADDR
jgi:hypothetical protein